MVMSKRHGWRFSKRVLGYPHTRTRTTAFYIGFCRMISRQLRLLSQEILYIHRLRRAVSGTSIPYLLNESFIGSETYILIPLGERVKHTLVLRFVVFFTHTARRGSVGGEVLRLPR